MSFHDEPNIILYYAVQRHTIEQTSTSLINQLLDTIINNTIIH